MTRSLRRGVTGSDAPAKLLIRHPHCPTRPSLPFAEFSEPAGTVASGSSWIKSHGLFGRNKLWRITVTREVGATVPSSGVPDHPLPEVLLKFTTESADQAAS
jgi:hypothetical protein